MYLFERIFALRALIAAAMLTYLPGGNRGPSCVGGLTWKLSWVGLSQFASCGRTTDRLGAKR